MEIDYVKHSLLDIIKNMNGETIYEWKEQRPVHLGEIIQRRNNWNIGDLNIWQNIPKRIDLNGDHKRLWDDRFLTSQNVFEEAHNSKPLIVL